MDLRFLLRSCRLFSDLNDHELSAIERIAVRKECRRGQIIFSEGEPSRGFCLVVTGTVKIYRLGPDGRERVFHVVEAGDAFAEAAMFMETYPATGEALIAGTTLILLEKNGFKQLLAHDPKLSFKIIGTLVRWLRQMRDSLSDLTLKEVPARFASYVLSHTPATGNTLTLQISKTTLAQIIGTTKETFSRMLHRLAKARVLTYRGNQVRIQNRSRLQAIADGEMRV